MRPARTDEPAGRQRRHWRERTLVVWTLAALATGCGRPVPGPETGAVTPVYDAQTGRLQELRSDRDRDGRQDTRALMDGPVLKSVEIDRNGDGVPDRWEYYRQPAAVPNQTRPTSVIERVEEANGSGRAITRREFYVDGLLQRVVDDTNADGTPDKWESYARGVLVQVEMDLMGKGVPTQRLRYDAAGTVIAVESDPDGSGRFRPVATTGGRR